MFASLLLGIALAVAPAVATPLPEAASAPPPGMEEVFAIPPPLREALHAEVIAPRGSSDQQRMERLVRFMFDPDGLGMQYQHDADHTVEQAWRTRRANCLSFTLLTIALAREAGITAFGQEIPRVLTWYREGDALYFSNHVNAGVRIAGDRYSIDVASDAILSGDSPRRIADQRLLAIFYSNRAAGLLARRRYREAGDYTAAAFAADSAYPATWNNAGVLALREGRQQEAEQHFRRTLELDDEHEGALMNLAALYASRGDKAGERQLRARIDRIQRGNPFHHFLLATEDEARGDYSRAARRYRRAIALHDREHHFHYGLARAYLHLGQYRKAGDSLRRAQALATESTAQRYQAKLDLLRRKGL
jgi:tetratricopeptide (TPR) repeat protein